MKLIPSITALLILLFTSTAICQERLPARGMVNVTVTKQRKMMVETRVNGVKVNFLLDTGAGDTYMSDRLAASLRLQNEGGGTTYNVLGALQFGAVNVDSLEIGASRVPVHHGLIHVSNLAWANKGAANGGSPVLGIIGSDILLVNRAVIDCAGERIYFGSPEAQGVTIPKRMATLARRRGDEIAMVARVNGVEGMFIVDTGYSVSLLSPDFAARLGAGGQGGGRSRTRAVKITGLELGMNRQPVRLGQMIVTNGVSVANQGYRDLGESPYDGVLGMDFLMENHVVIDCRQMQLHFD